MNAAIPRIENIRSPFLNLKQSAVYVGFEKPNSWQTIYHWIIRGWIKKEFVGRRGKEIVVLEDGLKQAVLAMYKARKVGRRFKAEAA